MSNRPQHALRLMKYGSRLLRLPPGAAGDQATDKLGMALKREGVPLPYNKSDEAYRSNPGRHLRAWEVKTRENFFAKKVRDYRAFLSKRDFK